MLAGINIQEKKKGVDRDVGVRGEENVCVVFTAKLIGDLLKPEGKFRITPSSLRGCLKPKSLKVT